MGFLRLTTDDTTDARVFQFPGGGSSPGRSAGATIDTRRHSAFGDAVWERPGRDAEHRSPPAEHAEHMLALTQSKLDELSELVDDLAPLPFPRGGLFDPDPDPPTAA